MAFFGVCVHEDGRGAGYSPSIRPPRVVTDMLECTWPLAGLTMHCGTRVVSARIVSEVGESRVFLRASLYLT